MAGVHGEKIRKLLENDKLPAEDVGRVEAAYERYSDWAERLASTPYDTVEDAVSGMVELLNDYKLYVDVDLIFDSRQDFLYRQKGQLKLDNTVMEEFLPMLVSRCIEIAFGTGNFTIGSQVQAFSSIHFNSSLANPADGGGISIKTKDQDFSIYRPLYLRASHNADMSSAVTIETALGYVCAELKTNLDKTMFQEASATAHDVRVAVSGAKYYLLADFLDMTPISTSTTDIEEILILRKAKRLSSNIRKSYSTSYANRQKGRDQYVAYLRAHPYAVDVFQRFINKVIEQISSDELSESKVLEDGWF